MPSWLPSIRYAPAQDGYWSPVTSTINWCEEDYYATIYSAEIVNTLTNLLFMFLATKGIRNCLQNGHDRIFLITYIGYLLVGSGSFAFHASLKYPMQLVDELSMIYTTCLMFHATFSFGKSQAFSIGMSVFLIALAFFITLYYHYLQDPTFHQNAYALLTTVVVFRSIYVMEVNIRPRFQKMKKERVHHVDEQNGALSEADRAETVRQNRRDQAILKTMWVMVAYGLSIFLGGFAIWNLDNQYCSQLRRWRHEIGLPWGILLEGHGWWHVMTGIGAYFYINWGIWLRHCLNGRQDEYKLVWPRLFTSLPTVVKQDEAMMNGNGKATMNGTDDAMNGKKEL